MRSLENTCHLSASAVVIHYEEALYQVYAPLPLPCQGPDYDHIIGAVHLGNFIAATNAAELGFTHVLNVADNLDMVYPTPASESGTTGDQHPSQPVNYRKIAMRDGAHNPIDRFNLCLLQGRAQEFSLTGQPCL